MRPDGLNGILIELWKHNQKTPPDHSFMKKARGKSFMIKIQFLLTAGLLSNLNKASIIV